MSKEDLKKHVQKLMEEEERLEVFYKVASGSEYPIRSNLHWELVHEYVKKKLGEVMDLINQLEEV